jgi:hypothetical protein
MIEYVLPFSRTGLGSIAHVGRKDASLGQLMAAWGTALSPDGHPPAALPVVEDQPVVRPCVRHVLEEAG